MSTEAMSLIDRLQREAAAWDAGSGDVARLLREAAAALSAQPLALTAATWTPAPASTEWGADMMAADIALSADETLTMYATRAGVALIGQPPAPSVPGWRLVPVEPTEAMLRTYTGGELTKAGFSWCRHQWAAMLSAAPPPVRERLTDEQIDAGIEAWFKTDITINDGKDRGHPFRQRMRAAIERATGSDAA